MNCRVWEARHDICAMTITLPTITSRRPPEGGRSGVRVYKVGRSPPRLGSARIGADRLGSDRLSKSSGAPDARSTHYLRHLGFSGVRKCQTVSIFRKKKSIRLESWTHDERIARVLEHPMRDPHTICDIGPNENTPTSQVSYRPIRFWSNKKITNKNHTRIEPAYADPKWGPPKWMTRTETFDECRPTCRRLRVKHCCYWTAKHPPRPKDCPGLGDHNTLKLLLIEI